MSVESRWRVVDGDGVVVHEHADGGNATEAEECALALSAEMAETLRVEVTDGDGWRLAYYVTG